MHKQRLRIMERRVRLTGPPPASVHLGPAGRNPDGRGDRAD